MGYQISAPPGITINQVDYDDSQLQNIANGRGWIGFTYWNGGTAPVHPNGTAVDAAASGPSLDTNWTAYWGIELRCVQSVCSWPGQIQLDQITVYASEAQGPSITPVADPSSLWARPGTGSGTRQATLGPLPVAGADSSGVCSLSLQVGASAPIADPSLPPPNNSSWQECQRQRVGQRRSTRATTSAARGNYPSTLQATNAAGLPNAPMSETLNVDNDPVSVSLSTPDDPNPTVWVNHAVTVDATPSTGPSGLGGMNCSVDGGAAQSYPAGGLDRQRRRGENCLLHRLEQRRRPAGQPQLRHQFGDGSHRRGPAGDEPGAREPERPDRRWSPIRVTASPAWPAGSIEMAPAGTGSWTSLPTTFTGSQLLAHFNDAGMAARTRSEVTSCDNVGNCASTTRTVMLPVADSGASREVSLEQLPAYAMRQAHGPSTMPRQLAAREAATSRMSDAGLSRGRLVSDSQRDGAVLRPQRAAASRRHSPPEGRFASRLRGASCSSRSHHAQHARSRAATARRRRSRPELRYARRRGSRPVRAWPLASR